MPRPLCCKDDVLTYETGSGEKDLHVNYKTIKLEINCQGFAVHGRKLIEMGLTRMAHKRCMLIKIILWYLFVD